MRRNPTHLPRRQSRRLWPACGLTLALCLPALPVLPQDEEPGPPPPVEDDSDKLGVKPPPDGEVDPLPTEAEADGEREGDVDPEDDDQLTPQQRDDELESAGRIRADLDKLLSAQARTNKDNGDFAGKLEDLANRCEVIANSVMSDRAKMVLLSSRAQALSVLIGLGGGQDPERTRTGRLAQLRETAGLISLLGSQGAEATADYWLLLAGLADVTGSKASVAARQALAERLLEAYIASYKEDEAANEHVKDARLSLARLLDERGDQTGAAKQLDAIGKVSKQSPRAQEVERLRRRGKLIGKAAKIEGVSNQLTVWRLSEQAGNTVLIHIYAESVGPSVEMIGQIQDLLADQALGGFRIVSLRVGKRVADSPQPVWPTLPVDAKPGGVLDQLGVQALPTLIWIDTQGKIVSIGHTLAVLDQQPKPEAEEDPDADPDAEPDADPAFEPEAKDPVGAGDAEAGSGPPVFDEDVPTE